MSLFKSLPREKQIVLRRINSLGEALQKGGDQFKVASVQAELTRLCSEINIDVNDVLSIYLPESRMTA